jgi:hypothetical protein
MTSYKDTIPLKKRIDDSLKIITKYPSYVPIVIECDDEVAKLVKKRKYLIDKDVEISYLLQAIRGKMTVDRHKAFFLFYNNVMISTSELIGVLYEKYKISNKITINDDQIFYRKWKFNDI